MPKLALIWWRKFETLSRSKYVSVVTCEGVWVSPLAVRTPDLTFSVRSCAERDVPCANGLQRH